MIVLCEDNRTFSFARSYLKKCGVSHGIRPVISPRGRGCGFDYVIKNFAVQVNAYKLASARLHAWLVAIVDADTGTVAQRIGQMNAELTNAQEPRVKAIRIEDERIARLIPRRNIETWILALNSKAVSENADYKDSINSSEGWSALIPPASETFYTWTRANAELPEGLIASLRHGADEMRRVFQLAR
ncbi:MAG: hypothetical protein P4N24_02130 [Acidobacteriota bacterium]|nr:hypothetical protein [Acidobacteriota bacterium]